MPRTKRRFADDDPDTDEEEQHVAPPIPRGGGKQLRMMGKQLRPTFQDDDEEEDSDDDDEVEEESSEEEEDSEEEVIYSRPGGGKQFRIGGGKQLHRPQLEESEEEEEDDDDDIGSDEQIRPVGRGGKSLMRMRPPEEEEPEPIEEEPVRPVMRPAGGKSLSRISLPMQEEEEEEEEEEEKPPSPVQQNIEEKEKPNETVDKVEEPAKAARTSSSRGKQQRSTSIVESESEFEGDEEDDEDFMDVDEDQGEESKPRARPSRAKTTSRRTSTRASEPPAKDKEDTDESEEESSEEERELDMETLDPQSLVKDEEDQKYLDSLPEFEREAILGERFEKLKNAADMKKALRESKRKEREEKRLAKEKSTKKPTRPKAAAKKTPAKPTPSDTSGDAEIAANLAGTRESTRNRDATGAKAKKSTALAAFREEKKAQTKRKEEEEEDDDDLDFGSDADDSDEDYQDSSEAMPWQRSSVDKRPRRDLEASSEGSDMEMESDEEKADVTSATGTDMEAELEDFMKVTIPRRRFARWVNEPFFDKAVKHCFARIFIGENEGMKCYRLCEIVGVSKSKTEYKLPPNATQKKPVFTNKILSVRFGTSVRDFHIYRVSDSRPTDEDVKKYIGAQKTARLKALGRKEASKLRRKQDELVHNYTYTQEDIERSLAERKKTGKALANLGLEQTRAAIAVQAARSALDDARRRLDDAKKTLLEFAGEENDAEELKENVESAEMEVDEAKKTLQSRQEEEKRILTIVEDRKKKLTKRRKDRNWQKVNERAAQMNQYADFESYKMQQARKEAESKSAPTFNPYARRKVKPKILWEVGQKEEKKDNGDALGMDVESREDVVAKTGGDQMETADPTDIFNLQKASVMDESHEFAIDEEDLAQSGTALLGSSQSKRSVSRVRRGLSLAEYQERKAAGTL